MCTNFLRGGSSGNPERPVAVSFQKLAQQTIEVLHEDTQGLVSLLWSLACLIVIHVSELYLGGYRKSRQHYALKFAHNGFEGGSETSEGETIQLLSL